MKLTDQETTLFTSLQRSDTGKVLLKFLERKTTELSDVRIGTYSNEARIAAIGALQEIIDRIRFHNNKGEPETYV